MQKYIRQQGKNVSQPTARKLINDKPTSITSLDHRLNKENAKHAIHDKQVHNF